MDFKERLKSQSYINLHLHTHFSILDGVGKVEDHIVRAHECGHSGVCVTDHGTCAGLLELYTLCHDKKFLKEKLGKNEFPCVLGSEFYIHPNLDERTKEHKYNHVTVLVKNEKGYQNLCRLTALSSLPDHFYSRPRISTKELFDYKEGLIVTSGCFIGMIPQAIHKGTGKEEELLLEFKKEFGEDFYIEIHLGDLSWNWDKGSRTHINTGLNPLDKVNRRLIELAREHNIQAYLTQDAHMPKKEHHLIQNIVIGNSPSGKDGWHFKESYYQMTVEEMHQKKNDAAPYITDEEFLELCQNSLGVLMKCEDLSLKMRLTLPRVNHEEHPVWGDERIESKFQALKLYFKDIDPRAYELFELAETDKSLKLALKIIVKNSKKKRIKSHSPGDSALLNPEYRERLIDEIKTIQFNGVIKLIDYFLPIEDVVSNCITKIGGTKSFGRGSGAGSLFTYLLDLTMVDPILYNLTFSRFMISERIGRFNFA